MAILKPEFWAKLLEKHGFSTLFALLLMAGLWKGSSAVFNEVALPIRDGHLKFLDRVATSTEHLQQSAAEVSEGIDEMKDAAVRIEAKLDRAMGKEPE